MWLEAILSKDNVISLVGAFLPLNIKLGENPEDGHYLELFEPRQVSLVEDQGLRMTCRARIRWPVLGIDLPVTVESVTLLLCPSVSDLRDRDELVFKLAVEAIDFAWAPAMVDHRIADKLNHELEKKRAMLSWRFGEALAHVFKMPAFLHPLDALALKVAWGQFRVTNEAAVLAISFHSRVLRGDGEHPPPELPKPELSEPPLQGPLLADGARPPQLATIVAVAGGAVLATLAAWVVVGAGARAWRYAARRM
ncbi:MAG TPA: hypothetical protein VK550_25105 [Polyangiaceae bacterium]|nr:hypothetical protein [Polyangiaceae bacterium]